MQGIGASPGCALGPVHHVETAVAEPSEVPRSPALSAAEDISRFTAAADHVAAALRSAAGQASGQASGQAAEILAATAEMAADPALASEAARLIREDGCTAERATWLAADALRQRLTALGGYLGERAADVADVRDRIIRRLRGEEDLSLTAAAPDEPCVLIAESLSPADTAHLDTARVLALVTVQGGPQSHSAILARALGIPAVVGAEPTVMQIPAGSRVFVDGDAGAISTDPGEAETARAEAWAAQRTQAPAFSGRGQLACGHRVALYANVGSAADATAAAQAGAEGIGLLRTEFLFLDRSDEPSVEEQAAVYAEIFACFPQQPVVIRTLDAGSDKPMPFITGSSGAGEAQAAVEPNPALGMRGFRTHSFAPAVLERQLAAIALAAARTTAEVRVMAPMITTAAESARFAELVAAAGLPSAGIMVETPAAALCALSTLAPVDFASIGTNDLTQYALAFDRELPNYGGLHSAGHPAVLSLIGATVRGAEQASAQEGAQAGQLAGTQASAQEGALAGVQAGQQANPQAGAQPGTQEGQNLRPVGVCGEAAADPQLAVILAGLGVTSLSMSAPALGRVAAALAEVTLDQARATAREALAGSVVTAAVAAPEASGTEAAPEATGTEAAPEATGTEAAPEATGTEAGPEASGTEAATASGTAETITRSLTVTAPTGLHARPAAVLAKALKALDAQVRIARADGGAEANGASVMEMMALGADAGQTIVVTASGPAADQAMTAVVAAATGDS